VSTADGVLFGISVYGKILVLYLADTITRNANISIAVREEDPQTYIEM
jgi:regulator of PEP synthase PpsR (kinase-PPPase family)